nr:MAG TPA: hypothetical protein [Caudoviricetes sp.]
MAVEMLRTGDVGPAADSDRYDKGHYYADVPAR